MKVFFLRRIWQDSWALNSENGELIPFTARAKKLIEIVAGIVALSKMY